MPKEVKNMLPQSTNIGAQIMVIQFPTGEYLVRYLVPSAVGGHSGKYSEGINKDYDLAVKQALAGLK